MKIKGVEAKMGKKAVETLVGSDKVSKSEKIRQLFASGYTINEIKDLVGVRYNFVYNVVQNYVITQGIEVEKTAKASKKDDVVKLLQEGKTLIEVATETKSNYNYVWKIAKEEGFTGKKEEVVEEVVEDKEEAQ